MAFTWKRPEGRLMSPEDMMRVIIRVADELDMPDKRGACIIAGMTVRQESDFWRPGNNADPAFKANPSAFPHDSMGNDGRSVGPYQQQTSGPPPASQWGWGGLYGDPEGTRKRMDPYESSKLFLAALKKRPYRAANAREAGDWAQDVQGSSYPDAYDDDWNYINDLYNRVAGTSTPPPPPPATYGMPRGSNSGGYGGNGVRFPDWVYALGNAFGLLPSTYPDHQESDRIEAGYARNPQRLNRGIDWAAPGQRDEIDRLTRFADYLATIPEYLEQVIWQNPKTMRSIEVAGGRHQPGYFRADLPGHRDHVHTRQSRPIPLPAGSVPAPVPQPQAPRPAFAEFDMFNGRKNSSVRSRPPMNFLLHTQEPLSNATAEDLARYCQGQNNVSYHYTIRDRKVFNVVDTDYYSWSVLEANVFTINLCFAGSSASQTRQQWLDRYGADIEVAAYLAVQDCKKYGMSTEVLVPRWDQRGSEIYAGVPRSGISDHNYVTRELGIGDHTDVGPNFPWDVFKGHVNKYATNQAGDDMAQVPQDQWDRVYRELTQRHPSRSPLRHLGEGALDTVAGFTLNSDGHGHVQLVKLLASLGHPESLALLHEVANADPKKHPDRQQDRLVAQAILSDLAANDTKGAPAQIAGTAAATVVPEVVYVPAESVSDAGTTGQLFGAAYDALAALKKHSASLPAEAKAPLDDLITILQPTGKK